MSDLYQSQAECPHLWKDGWCSSCGIGWATWSSAEIDRLHAEVERLTSHSYQFPDIHKEPKDCPSWYDGCCCFEEEMVKVKRERDEALAQVAVLSKMHKFINPGTGERSYCRCGRYMTDAGTCPALDNLPTEARALLDRLQLAEAVAEAAKQVTQGHREECFESSDPVGPLAKALAAWEERYA